MVADDTEDNGDNAPVLQYREERRVSWEFLFVAFVLTLTLMAGMFFMGQALSNEKVDRIGQALETFGVEQTSQDLSQRIAKNLPHNNCRALNVATRQTIDDIRQLRDDMQLYEQARKLGNEDYTILKKQYTNLLLEYWLTAQEIETMCGSDIVKVLYIYSDRSECPRCSDQGTILTKYRRMYDDRLLVFPLDATLDMKPVNLILDSYDIETYPAIIVDDTYHEGFINDEELGNILEQQMAANTTNQTAAVNDINTTGDGS